MHCIIAYAASARLPADAPDGLHLPRLSALLARLHPGTQDRDPADEQPPAAPAHERAHARALGWAPHAALPWAAWQTHASDTTPQAWITPCHWQIGMDQVYMLDPADLDLDDEASRALLHSLQPLLQEDGLQVVWHDALHWHARGEPLGGWNAPSLDRLIGANVRPWITSGVPKPLVRLQSEMQMLAYPHPVNEARLARGQRPINAFWIHGAGALPSPMPAPTSVQYLDALRAPALRGDVQGWRNAWQALDAQLPSPDTEGLQLTLCSESTAQSWQAPRRRWLARLQQALRRPDTTLALKALIDT